MPATLRLRNPGEIWPDDHGVHINAHGGGILSHGGVYYWFGEHKIGGKAGNQALVGVHVYESQDLYHWKDRGIALTVSKDPKSDIAAGCILERPKVIFNAATGKFVMWFHLEPKGAGYAGARSGVAVADEPTGPYRFIESFRPNAGVWSMNVAADDRKELTETELDHLASLGMVGGPVPEYPTNMIYRRDFAGGQMARDMTLFVDDDGSAYHFYASEDNGTMHVSLLSPDYLKPAGKYVRIFPGRFNEAPTVFKRHGRYYLITSGCTGWDPNPARLAVASSIWGPWEEKPNPCVGPGANLTFGGQGTYVQQAGDAYLFMADRWTPANAIDGRYLWLPIEFAGDLPQIPWRDVIS